MEYDEEYIGESSRTFGGRFKEHLKAPSPIYDHSNITGHNVTMENFSIVGREDQNLCRWIKEALYIRVNSQSLNKNIGKYHLPHIWDEVLHNTSEPKVILPKYPSAPWGITSTRRETLTPCSGYSTCHMAITSAPQQTTDNMWPFHLPLGNNISQHKSCNIL